MRGLVLSTFGKAARVGVWAAMAALATYASAQSSETAVDPARASAHSHRKAERDRIRHERAVIASKRQQDEAECYKRFSVEDCLRGVRAQARDAEVRLRHQELELNDSERKEKAEDRLRSIEDKTKAVPAPPSQPQGHTQGKTQGQTGAQGTVPGVSVRNPRSADPEATKAQREHDAERRAQDQRNKVQAQANELAARNIDNADRAAKARARQAEALQAAQERRARVQKSQADAAAGGRKAAAPLPADSSAR